MIKIYNKKNQYYLKVNNKIVFVQPIIKSDKIPKHITPNLYWYMYMLIIAYEFGYIKI